jgi:hypothetical protein
VVLSTLRKSSSSLHLLPDEGKQQADEELLECSADNSNTLAQYQAAAKNVANSVTPANVEGGVLGPLKVATTSSAAPSPSSKNAGSRTGGDIQWVVFGVTGALAMVFGALII